ncbi:DUF6507 family protein [Nocardiopsis alba]|uniref:DUF6507 family protein n=1 Tax=Nocardiopsis alba TaxID=53437 RepID=UPI00034DE776|nr:DUF6507 family protein [Nocardiopsis alba]
MSKWNLDTEAVGVVLETVAGHFGEEGSGEGFVGIFDELQDSLEQAGEYSKDDAVNMALMEFAGHYFGVLGGMASLTTSAISGATQATIHYIEGDLENAEEAQRNAGVIPDPEP